MDVRYYSPDQLWKMKPDEFNAWRIQNDLPLLLSFLCEILPRFEEWLNEYNISNNEFINAPHTGIWFLGNAMLYFNKLSKDGKEFINITKTKIAQEQLDSNGHEMRYTKAFVPYLKWAKEKILINKFILYDTRNNQRSNTFVYNTHEGVGNPGISRAYLFGKFKVLKLGGIKVGPGMILGNRNLDFTDFDYLTIRGEHHGPYATYINFSSCDNITIENAWPHHVYISGCNIDKFYANNSRLQDFYFDECAIKSPRFDNSDILSMEIKNSSLVNPYFFSTDIKKFNYTPRKTRFYDAEVNNFRILRSAFQNMGKREEARKYYYLERCYERKGLFSPYSSRRSEFPRMGYGGTLKELIERKNEGTISDKKFWEIFIKLCKYHILKWIIPKYFVRALKYKFRYFISLLEYIVWGYGEKPLRVLLNGAIIIFIYSILYCFMKEGDSYLLYGKSLYFSIVTFTTLGYGDVRPSEAFQLICASEAILGAITMGLVVAAFSIRSRY